MKKIKLIFLLHCLVALLGYMFLIIMPIGLFRLIISTVFDIWIKGFLLGTMYISLIYAVNHLGNAEGFCLLTDLENHYRKQEGLPLAPKRFVPRFNKAVIKLFKRTK
jgi:hypothetical protein